LDEDVDVLIAALVRSVGFGATTVHDARREAMSDADQLVWATSRDLVFVTHNRVDFARLGADYSTTGRSHGGIVIAKRRSAHEVAARLVALLNAVPASDIRNTVRYI
jgi:hypothetical protein